MNSQLRTRRNQSLAQRRRGFMLIVAVMLMVLFGVTLAVLGAHFAGTIRAARAEDLEIRATQILHSGVAWAEQHRDDLPQAGASPEEKTVDVSGLCGPNQTASLTFRRADDGSGWVVAVRVQRGGHVVALSGRYAPAS